MLELRKLVVSVVSHGHGALVQSLLEDLAQLSANVVARVVLTLNLPEPEPVSGVHGGWPFVLEVRRNVVPAGFAVNHNRALENAGESFVGILNPDVRLEGRDPFADLVAQASFLGVGCVYPIQVDEYGGIQDSERALPTPAALWRRRIRGQQDIRVDWVNAACLVLPQPVWQAIGGFDERYFMYCEDVDLCLRLRLAGWALVRVPVKVVHAGQRNSRRKWRHLRWHVVSLLRLWRSPAYGKTIEWLRTGQAGTGTISGS